MRPSNMRNNNNNNNNNNNKGTTEYDKNIVTCNVGTANMTMESLNVIIKNKGTIECGKSTVICDVSTI